MMQYGSSGNLLLHSLSWLLSSEWTILSLRPQRLHTMTYNVMCGQDDEELQCLPIQMVGGAKAFPKYRAIDAGLLCSG